MEAQRWALKVLQQTEEDANRRGCRGSKAWEDAWRDALWTLAVQKRCVEVEARKGCNTAAALPVLPAAAPSEIRAAIPELGMPPKSSRCSWQEEPKQDPSMASISHLQAEVALRQGAAAFEKQCLEPIHRRLDNVEERVARMLSSLQVARKENSRRSGALDVDSAASRSGSPGKCAVNARVLETLGSAGPLPMGPGRQNNAPASLGQQVQIPTVGFQQELTEAVVRAEADVVSLQHQLADAAACADAESRRCGEAERQRELVERKLRHVEVEHEEARTELRRAELRVEQEVRQREEAESSWQQRHAALQRQLRRTEIALGEAHVLRESESGDRDFRRAPDSAHDLAERERGSSDSSAVLDRWREVRKQGGGRRAGRKLADEAAHDQRSVEFYRR